MRLFFLYFFSSARSLDFPLLSFERKKERTVFLSFQPVDFCVTTERKGKAFWFSYIRTRFQDQSRRERGKGKEKLISFDFAIFFFLFFSPFPKIAFIMQKLISITIGLSLSLTVWLVCCNTHAQLTSDFRLIASSS